MNKIIIGVLACDKYKIMKKLPPPTGLVKVEEDYTELVKACRETCYSETVEGVEVYYIYGHRKGVYIPKNSYKLEGDCFYNDSPEGRENCLAKTLGFFEYCLKNKEFDYIFRANCGSYIDQKILKEFSEKLPKEKLYCGRWGEEKGIPYCSGTGYFLSRDLVEMIVGIKKIYDKKEISPFYIMGVDDLSIGSIMYENGIDRTGGAYREDVVLDEIVRDDFFINENCYHYYFKHTIEPKCFYELHKKINSKGL